MTFAGILTLVGDFDICGLYSPLGLLFNLVNCIFYAINHINDRSRYPKYATFYQRSAHSKNLSCVPGRRRLTHTSFCLELIVLSGACVVLTPSSSYRQVIMCMSHLLKFHTNQDFDFKYHILYIMYNTNRIFNSWELYRSRPSAGNKQSIRIVRCPRKIKP